MKIAIIGSGISGMVAAHKLAPDHEVTLFEASPRLGGHTATMDVGVKGKTYAIDTGFIVFNDWTYPEFIKLMDELGVPSQPTEMSFSVSDAISGIEYAGSNLNSLFGQRRNLVSAKFLTMVKDIVRFNNQAERHLSEDAGSANMTLGEYLERYNYSAVFRDLYLIPMGAAIWSSNTNMMMQFPLQFFVQFFRNHGLLNIKNRPQWRVIKGGSRSYIKPLTENFRNSIELENPVHRVKRVQDSNGSQHVILESHKFKARYDQVIFACHSDQALKILADPTEAEKSILSSIPYTSNEVVLHTDARVLPATKRCWSSWNVALNGNTITRPALTYNMNILQGIQSNQTFCVTLNQTESINKAKILGIYEYDHPVFTDEGIKAQQRWGDINGANGTWYCGAYWRNGFHEDGVWSALRVVRHLNEIAVNSEAMDEVPALKLAV